jgi:hypothetical protein
MLLYAVLTMNAGRHKESEMERTFEFMDKYGARLYPRIQDMIPVLGDILTDDKRVGCDINIEQIVGGCFHVLLENDADYRFSLFRFNQDDMLDTGVCSERQYGTLEMLQTKLSDSEQTEHFEMIVKCLSQNRIYVRETFN